MNSEFLILLERVLVKPLRCIEDTATGAAVTRGAELVFFVEPLERFDLRTVGFFGVVMGSLDANQGTVHPAQTRT